MENSLGLYIVGAFLLVNLMLGLWAGRGVKDIRDYAVGNKRWGVGALVMSTIATAIGGGFVLVSAKEIYNDGLVACIPLLGMPISYIIRAIFYTKTYDKFKAYISLPEILGASYGKEAKIISSLVATIFCILICSLQIKTLSLVFSELMHYDPTLSVVLSGAVIVLYTAFGGMRAVVATDIFQFIMIFGVFLVLATLAVNYSGGMQSIIKTLPENFNSVNSKTLWPYLSIFLIDTLFLQEASADPPKVERFQMASDKRSLKRILYFTALGTFIGAIVIIVLAYSILHINGAISLDVNPLTWFYFNVVPEKYQYFIIVGLIAIVLSSGDSWLHSAGNSFTRDFYNSVFKKNLSITATKFAVFILGTLSIYIALYGESLIYNMRYLLSLVSPLLCVPFIVALLGLKTSKKMFFASISFSVSSFFFITFFSEYENMALFFATCIGLIAILVAHLHDYSSFTLETLGNSKENLFKKHFKFNFLRFNTFCERNVKILPAQYVLFAISFIIAIITLFTFMEENKDIYELLLGLKLIAAVLCSLLITHSIWPSRLKKYRPAFWYLTLTYCLPFLSTIMLILSHGAMEYTINIAINIMFLLLLVDWASAIGIGVVGTASAIGYYKFFVQTDPTETIFGFETKYLLIYQIIFGTIIGLLFARKKHIRIKSLDENTDFLEELQQNIIETNNMSIAIADDANSTPENINLHPAENLEAVRGFLYEKNLLVPEISQKLAELEIFIAAEEKNISPYMVLNAHKVELLKISEKFESFSKACACENTYVYVYTKEKTVKWDSSQMIKCIGKLAQNYHKKMKKFYDEDSDIFLNITISDEKIKYISATDPTISREISAIGVILSENENFYSTLKNKVFEKVMTDPEKIPSTRVSDHKMIDIERTIDAHYGVLQTIEDEESLNYICVLPINVYDIRPITLDMDAPIVRELSYNWPAAEKLEADFWEKASSIDTISKNKIEKAIDYIKIYHRHQTRKSGEPYYLHPMSVAMIAIDIAKESSEIHSFLMENIETIILVALLHDILEDTYIKHKNILQSFGGEVLRYIESVTKTDFKQREFLLSNDQAFTKLINQEPITVCVKIADRIHNLYTIDGHPKMEKRKAVAEETMMFFTRAAKKYGMEKLASKLTTMCNYIIENGKLEGWKE